MNYFDSVATTPLNIEVLTTYHKLLEQYFCNADSLYDQGIAVNQLIEKSREHLATMLHVASDELIFTSCGSESNSLAVKGTAFSYQNRGKHIITTIAEHSSVYNSCRQLEQYFGFEVTYLPLNKDGKVNLADLASSIRPDTILVSIMYVNNELGSINDIKAIKQLLKQYPQIIFHVDMVQALGKLTIDLQDIDLASFSAHKINGLKGSGLLYKRKGLNLLPLISGGQQEFGLRGGTENACTNIVLAKTLRLALEKQAAKAKDLHQLNIYTRKCLTSLDDVVINSPKDAIDTIINISCLGYKPETIMHSLEEQGFYVSTKSACSSKSSNVSRVMAHLDIPLEYQESAMRISLSYDNTKDQVDQLIKALQKSLRQLKKRG